MHSATTFMILFLQLATAGPVRNVLHEQETLGGSHDGFSVPVTVRKLFNYYLKRMLYANSHTISSPTTQSSTQSP